MTNERHEAYKRALAEIERVGPAKLHPEESELLRDAAEGLLLATDADSADAAELRAKARRQLADLVESERWLEESAEKLLFEIEACCPEPVLSPA